MKVFVGVVGFIGFVGALMAGAWVAARPEPRAAATMTTTTLPSTLPSTKPPARPPAAVPPPAPPVIARQPVPLPPLFVFKDDRAPTAIALAGPRDKPVLLHLWASWCGPCRAELPSLLAFGRQGFVDVLAVTVDDRFDDVRRFFDGKIPAEVVWDKNITLEPTLGVRSIPTTFLVDTQGRVVERFDGMQPWDNPALEKALRDALAAR